MPESLAILLRGQLKYMQNYYEVVGITSPGATAIQLSENRNLRLIEIEMSRKISPVKDFISLIRLVKVFYRERPQIVHTHTPKAGTAGMLASWLCRVPVRLHTVAGLPLLEATGKKRWLLNFVEKITYACATKVYPNSFGLKEIILEQGFAKPDQLKVIGNGSSNGIDTTCFSKAAISQDVRLQIRNTWQIKPGDFVYVFVGRLVKDKGINELVSAFVKVNNRFPQTKLLLVGDFEPELDPLDQQTMDVIANHIHIIPVGFQADVRPFLAVSNALVFPSYREGFPNVPMQACAMDLPCIVSDINGCNEIIIHEDNGLIIPVKNEQAIEEAMIRLLEDQALYQHLVSNARISIVTRYDQLTLWKLIKAEYDEQLRLAGIL